MSYLFKLTYNVLTLGSHIDGTARIFSFSSSTLWKFKILNYVVSGSSSFFGKNSTLEPRENNLDGGAH